VDKTSFFAPLVSSENNRKTFVSAVISWLRKYDLDGLDLDWEFPTGTAANNFATLFAELRSAIDSEHAQSGKDALLLSVASFGDASDLNSWPIAQMAKSIDWFNIMTYEEHGPWDDNTPTGINAPIKSSDGFDLTDAVNGYLKLGVAPSKILLGLPTFAHSWILKNANQHGIGAPGAGSGTQGKCTKTPGYLAYWEVKDMYISKNATVVWDAESQTPYLYEGKNWVSYENPQSYRAKADLVVSKNLRGAFVWDIDEDDNNELINALVSQFNNATHV